MHANYITYFMFTSLCFVLFKDAVLEQLMDKSEYLWNLIDGGTAAAAKLFLRQAAAFKLLVRQTANSESVPIWWGGWGL